MQATTGIPVRLNRRLHLLSASYNWILLGSVLLLLLALVALVALNAARSEAFWPAVRQTLSDEPELWLLAVLLPIAAILVWVISRYERLTLTSTGIEYRSLFRGPLAFLRPLRPDWRLAWEEIESARLKTGPSLPRTRARPRRIVFTPQRGTERTLHPYAWYGTPDEAGLKFSQIFKLEDEEFLQAVRRSPLYRACIDRGLLSEAAESGDAGDEPEKPLADLPGGSFDIARHPGMLGLMLTLFALGAYAVADWFFLRPWMYLEYPPAAPFVLTALLALALGATLGRGAPVLERFSLALLFAAAATAAVVPGLLRFNAATDSQAPRTHVYVSAAPGEFRPADDPALPELRFDDPPEFWRAIPEGSQRRFLLARGELGFWQLDMRPVREDMRAYFQGAD